MEVFTACHEHLHAITFGTFNSADNKEKFLEGPVTVASGMLFFTDMDVNYIYKMSPDDEYPLYRNRPIVRMA